VAGNPDNPPAQMLGGLESGVQVLGGNGVLAGLLIARNPDKGVLEDGLEEREARETVGLGVPGRWARPGSVQWPGRCWWDEGGARAGRHAGRRRRRSTSGRGSHGANPT
jgi:hypothetical protein